MGHVERWGFVCACALAGCTTRPVSPGQPTVKTNFSAVVAQSAVDKVDLLFMIDNSASMGDKQDYLRAAVPDLVTRLVTPNCVDPANPDTVVGISHDNGVCDQGKVEFPPVHDMHIGIVSSSLGTRGGDVCDPSPDAGLGPHQDDHAWLLDRAGDDEHALTDAEPSNFLAWFPSVPDNSGKQPSPGAVPVGDPSVLERDFSDLVSGVHQLGCGIESQLESWYRFLVQPDPYDHITTDANGIASWVGVDVTILRQRHDFLRADSLVAVITLSDENDSEIDARSYGGTGVKFLRAEWQPPHGTSACAANPADPSCTSCSFLSPAQQGADPRCADGGAYSGFGDWGFNPNLRHVHMKEKYGVDPQFGIDRYVQGLTSTTVPNRDGAPCTNPLFAESLPDGSSLDGSALCNLPQGQRTSDLVFYAHIGGVPSQLLHTTPGNPAASLLGPDDWTRILGRDPESFDPTGIDPHMIESYAPRPGLPGPSSPDDADPISGREWNTQGTGAVDLELACTFPLSTPRDCTQAQNQQICDCPAVAGPTHDELPPLCSPTNPTLQIRAKAYPTVRELLLAKKLGSQGIVSSICPIHVAEEAPGDPLYGYRPAVAAIVDRLKSKLTNQCVPHALTRDPTTGQVPCLVLETLRGQSGDEAACAAVPGLRAPDPAVLARFRQEQDPSLQGFPVCEVAQLGAGDLVGGSCATSSSPGWCYVTGDPSTSCENEILFSPSGAPKNGALVSIQCIEANPSL